MIASIDTDAVSQRSQRGRKLHSLLEVILTLLDQVCGLASNAAATELLEEGLKRWLLLGARSEPPTAGYI